MESVTEQTLADKCRAAGDALCKLGSFVFRQVNQQLDDPLTADDWAQHGRVAAFLAFIQMGGDGDRPDDFDWTSKDFTRRALSVLQQLTLGSQSDVYDRIMRARSRRTVCQVDELAWDTWQHVSADDFSGHRSFEDVCAKDDNRATDKSKRYVQEAVARPILDDTLVTELTKNLNPQEAVWLIRRYRDGIPTAVLAEELVKKSPKYQTEDGFTRAVRCIDVAVYRARGKARKILGDHWQRLAQEVA